MAGVNGKGKARMARISASVGNRYLRCFSLAFNFSRNSCTAFHGAKPVANTCLTAPSPESTATWDRTNSSVPPHAPCPLSLGATRKRMKRHQLRQPIRLRLDRVSDVGDEERSCALPSGEARAHQLEEDRVQGQVAHFIDHQNFGR